MSDMSIGEAMRKARREKHVRVVDLAKRTGISKTTIWGYERDVGLGQTVNLMALADVLGISLDEYVGHEIQKREEDENYELY